MSVAWTLGDLLSNTTIALGNRADIGLSTASLWINEAQTEVWNQLPFDEQEAIAISSTTVNEDKITLPSDFQEIIALSNTSQNNRLLNQINRDQLMAFSATSGIPTHYAFFDDWLEMRPTPDSAYSLELRYRKQLSTMTETTDPPSVSTRFRRAIFLKAVELMAQNVTFDERREIRFHNQYINHMASLPSDRALRQREQHAAGCSLGRSRGQLTRDRSNLSFDRRTD